jgi:hypothetical protein
VPVVVRAGLNIGVFREVLGNNLASHCLKIFAG